MEHFTAEWLVFCFRCILRLHAQSSFTCDLEIPQKAVKIHQGHDVTQKEVEVNIPQRNPRSNGLEGTHQALELAEPTSFGTAD